LVGAATQQGEGAAQGSVPSSGKEKAAPGTSADSSGTSDSGTGGTSGTTSDHGKGKKRRRVSVDQDEVKIESGPFDGEHYLTVLEQTPSTFYCPVPTYNNYIGYPDVSISASLIYNPF